MTDHEHHFTVDVEEYFHVAALEPVVARESWAARESRVGASLDRILAMLDEAGARGTFFVLGWLAERQPQLVRRIAERGHEIASHGWGHRAVTSLDPARFRESVRRSRSTLEDVSGTPVRGYRAPSFTIVPGREWALEVLVEEGYAYDSSLFPVRRRGSGYPGAPRDPHVRQTPSGELMEFPLATARLAGRLLPAGGGAYLRLLPYPLVAAGLRQAAARGVPGTFYVHPWEIDAGQPRLTRRPLTRIRHYGGLGRMERRLARLLAEFRFRPIATTLEAQRESSAA